MTAGFLLSDCRVQTKNEFTFWLIFGPSPNLGLGISLGERLCEKLKSIVQ